MWSRGILAEISISGIFWQGTQTMNNINKQIVAYISGKYQEEKNKAEKENMTY